MTTDIHSELDALPKMPPHEWQYASIIEYASIIAFYSHRLREAEKHLRALKALAYSTEPDEWQAIHDARAYLAHRAKEQP